MSTPLNLLSVLLLSSVIFLIGTFCLSASGWLRHKTPAGPYGSPKPGKAALLFLFLLGSGTILGTGSAAAEITYVDISGAEITLVEEYLTYNGADQTVSVSAVTLGSEDITAFCDISDNTGKNAGGYFLTVTAKEGSNYTGSVLKEFDIYPKQITAVITVSGEYTYTGSGIIPDYTVKDNGTELALSDYTAEISDNVDAGTGKITVTVLETGNYLFDQTEQGFTINKADWTESTTANGNAMYGNTGEADLSALIAPGGTAGELTVTDEDAVLDGTPVVSEGKLSFAFVPDAEKVGRTARIIVPVNGATNYNDYSIAVTLTVTGKNNAGVSISEGSSLTKTFGDSDVRLTAEADDPSEGGVWTWTSSDGTVASVTNEGVVTIKNKGETEITAAYVSDSMIGSAALKLTVEPKPVTVTANDKDKMPGEPDPELTATVEGTLGEDTVAYTLSRAEGETPGIYAIAVSGESLQGNYEVSFVNGTFTIVGKKTFAVTVTTDGNGTASAEPASGPEGTEVTLTAKANTGYKLKEWQVVSGGVSVKDDRFTIGTADVEIKAVFEEETYFVAAGDKQDYISKSGEDKTFCIKRTEQDDLTFSHFDGILVDGSKVETRWYTWTPGSVIIKLKYEYLETLEPGKHNMTVLFTDGETEAAFEVTRPETPTETMTRTVEIVNLLYNGSKAIPQEISEMSLEMRIAISGGDMISRSLQPVTLDLIGGGTPTSSQNVEFSRKISDLAPGKYTVTVTGLPKEVSEKREIYSAEGPAEEVVMWKYALSTKTEINQKDGKMVIRVYLIWDNGDRPEEVHVYPLPEDEIGAYWLKDDGTKEYLLFHTYDICMAWLGSDDLCKGPKRCFHKDNPYVNPFVQP